MITKRDRFLIAARGGTTGYPPIGTQVHYGPAKQSPQQVAEAHLRSYCNYDWSFIRVMYDYRTDLPEGLEGITDPTQLDGILVDPGVLLDSHVGQHEVLELIRTAALETIVVEMVFLPTQAFVRTLGGSVIEYFKVNPALAHRAISRVVDTSTRYAAGLDGFGVDTLFVAVNGTSRDATGFGLTPEQLRDWIAPYDIQVLATTLSPARVTHLHGEDAGPELITDYPVEVLSWSDTSLAPTIPRATNRHS